MVDWSASWNKHPPERRRIVVDGSNIATEGRTLPSLAQLDEAIRTFLEEYRGFTTSDVTVVVDASFGHRIDPSEVTAFDQAVEHGEMITPPAGAVGRGDGFILRIAEKSGALVLSNDSFQEFHAERPWLFEPGRLIGGKPVPGVGWIFTPRTPVRGARSRSVTGKSRREAKAADADGSAPVDRGVHSGDGDQGDPGDQVGPEDRQGDHGDLLRRPRRHGNGGRPLLGQGLVGTAKPAKATKATKATNAGKATKAAKASKAAKAAGPARPPRQPKRPRPARRRRPPRRRRATRRPATAPKPPKPARPPKRPRPPRPAKATKATKASQAGQSDQNAPADDGIAASEADGSATPGRRSRRNRSTATVTTDDRPPVRARPVRPSTTR